MQIILTEEEYNALKNKNIDAEVALRVDSYKKRVALFIQDVFEEVPKLKESRYFYLDNGRGVLNSLLQKHNLSI